MSQTKPLDLILTCPYCLEEFHDKGGDLPNAPSRNPTEPILCLPYSRDIGKFDDGKWSQIGRDFFAEVLGWERFGILRTLGGESIYYRVAECPACRYLFDVFLNLSPGHTLAEIWPHLLAPNSESSSDTDIKRYQGRSRTMTLLEKIMGAGEFDLLSELILLIGLGILASFVSLIPDLIQSRSMAWGQDQLAIVMIRLGGGLWLGLLLLLLFRFIQYLGLTNDFDDLLDVRRSEHITFWLNFTLCRAVGAQEQLPSDEKDAPGKEKAESVTQVSLIGRLAVLILLLVWAFARLVPNGPDGLLAGLRLAFPVLILYLLGAWWQANPIGLKPFLAQLTKKASHWFNIAQIRTWISQCANSLLPVKPYGVVIAGAWTGIWTIYYVFQATGSTMERLSMLTEVTFWAIVAYYAGTAMWIGLNTSGYIIRQVRRLPLILDPLDGFRRLAPLEKIAGKSTSLILVNVVAILFIATANSLASGQAQLDASRWLLTWVSIGIMVILIGTGVVLSLYSKSVLIAGCIYILLMLAQSLSGISRLPLGNPQSPIVSLDPGVLITGVFLTFVIYFHTRGAYRPLSAIRDKAKKRFLEKYDLLISGIQQEIAHLAATPDELRNNTIHNLCENLDSLSNLRNRINQADASPWKINRPISIMAPFFLSIALQILQDQLAAWALNAIQNP